MRRDRLATVLRVRRVQEQAAAARTAVAEAERRAAAVRVADRRADVAVPRADRHVVELAWQAVDRAAVAHAAAVVVADGERAQWADAARRVKGLERLDERLQTEARLEEQRRLGATLDDLVTTRVARTAPR